MRRSELKRMMCGVMRRLNQLSLLLENLKLADYLKHLGNTKRMLWVNFLGGLARGFGIAIGFTLLGAIVLYFLQKTLLNNLPVIGNIIADIVKIANDKLQLR